MEKIKYVEFDLSFIFFLFCQQQLFYVEFAFIIQISFLSFAWFTVYLLVGELDLRKVWDTNCKNLSTLHLAYTVFNTNTSCRVVRFNKVFF